MNQEPQNVGWLNQLSASVVELYKAITPKWILRFRLRTPRGWEIDFYNSVE